MVTMTADTSPAAAAWTAAMDAAGKRWRRTGRDTWEGQCPAHDDRSPSMTARWFPPAPPERAGRVVLNCKAGCDQDSLPAALGLTWADLYDGRSELGRSPNGARTSRRPAPSPASKRSPRPPAPRSAPERAPETDRHQWDFDHPEATHAYTDAAGEVLARVDRLRCADPACPPDASGKRAKRFVVRHPDGRPGRGSDAARRLAAVLYRLPDVLAATAAGRPVYVCEGEGDADALAAAGECGTSAFGGAARAWTAAHSAPLAGAHVVIVADRDRAGYRRAAAVAAELARAAPAPASVRIVQAAIVRPGADVSDHLAAGLGVADLADASAEVYGSTSEHAAPGDPAAPAPGRRGGPAPADDAAPRYRLPASSGAWAYATGDDGDGRERGVYRLVSAEVDPDDPDAPRKVWQWTEFLPYVFERVAYRDGTGRRARMAYRLGTRLDAPPDERAVCGHLAVKTGEWAEPLGIPLSADPKVIQAVASAIYREAERSAPLVEAAPRWTPAGALEMPPADVGPAGYGLTAGAETDARAAWAELAGILGRHGKAAMITGAAVAAPYLDALPPPRQSFIVHSAGRERRGKTTAHVVSAAVYGDPEVIVRPWDVSAIGLATLAGEYGCLPPILDELGARRGPRAELQHIVFQLAQGARRTKGTRDGRSTVTAPWRGAVLSTGNVSLLACLTERGAMARVIEVPTPIIGTDDASDDPAAAADAERLESLAAEWFGWPFAWLRAAGITPERFGALLAAARADLEMPAAGTPRTIARHLAACVAGAAALDAALGTAVLRPAALAAAAVLLAEMTERLAEMAAPPGERLAAAVAHAVISRAEAFPALGELRESGSGRRFKDGEGFTITAPSYSDGAAPALAARWDPPPGLAVGDVGVWSADIDKIRQAAGLDDTVTALRELRAAGRLITGGEKGGAQMRYRVRVAGQTVPAYVFRLDGMTADDDAPAPGGGQADDDDGERYARPMADLVGTVGTDHLANPLPAETSPEAVPTSVGTDHLGRHRTPPPAPANPLPAETAPAPAPDAAAAESAPASVSAGSGPVPTSAEAVPTSAERFALGPLLLADADALYLADGSDMAAPDTLADVLELAAGLGLGTARLHRYGRDDGPHLYLTPAACERYGIPPEPPDDDGGQDDDAAAMRRTLALPDDHPAAVALRSAGWQVTALRPSARVWRDGPERASVSLSLLGWIGHADPVGLGALLADAPSPASLAARLGTLARLTAAPTWTAGVTSERMMTALRPAERVRRDPQTGNLERSRVKGSLPGPARPSVYDAPDSHPVARDRPPGIVCRDEALEWIRPVAEWADAERAAPFAVTVDVCAAFLAAAGRLPVGLSEPREMTAAELEAMNADPSRWLRNRPGVFVAEVAGLREQLDPRLPCPLTQTGTWPGGPVTLHAPALRYALEFPGVTVTVAAGAISDECGPYLTPWAERLTAAYLETLAAAGITPDMDPATFIEAYATMPERAPDAYAVRRAVQALYKAGLGRMRHADERARDRATWRPDIRAEVISRARTDLHRKLVKVHALTGAAPLAVSTDAVTYASPDASALSVIPWRLDGGPIPGALRLGPRPGYVKPSHAEPMTEALARAAEGDNPAIHRVPDDDAPGGE